MPEQVRQSRIRFCRSPKDQGNMSGKLYQFGSMSAANLFDHGFFGKPIICQYLQLDEFVVIQGTVYLGIHRIRQDLDDDNGIKLVTDAAEVLAGLVVQAHEFSKR